MGVGAGIKKMGNDFITGATGEIGKALLCVYALPKSVAQKDTSPDSRSRETEQQLKKIQQKMKGIYDIPAKDSSGKTMGQRTESYKQKAQQMGLATLEVDYNPSSISFSSQAGEIIHEGVAGAGASLITMDIPAEVVMNVDLVFDDMNVKDAFMWEKFRLSVGDMAAGIQGIARKLGSKGPELDGKTIEGFTVQIPIDGIVALIGHQTTRQIMFIWNRMIFAGELTSVRAKYTMFNPTGNPVRGVVSLTIRQGIEEASLAELKYWNNAFDKLFKVDDKNRNIDTQADSADMFSKVGSLIQL